ncbi:MAG: ROK family protein [Candidatus Dormiibacterota bacterium]
MILEAVQRAGAISRSQLVGLTRLTPATITNAVRELLDLHLLAETGRHAPRPESRAGAPSFLLTLDDSRYRVLALHQGVSLLRLGVVDIAGQVLATSVLHTISEEAPRRTVARIAKGLRALSARTELTEGQVLGLGVGAVGLVEPESGNVHAAPNLGWTDVPLGRWLAEELGIPVVVRNNVHGMAAGELRFTGIPERHALYVYVGYGIGAGIVVDGRVLDGAHGAAGELGHLVVPGGGACTCGKVGCVETVAAERAIVRRAAAIVGTPEALPGTKEAVERLVRLAVAGDSGARSVLAEVAEALGQAVAQAVEVVDPRVVILGGTITEAGDLVLTPLAEALHRTAFSVRGRRVEVRVAARQQQAGLVGAATLALDELLYNPDSMLFADRPPLAGEGRRWR